MTSEVRLAVLKAWASRTTTEYATGALTAELLHQLACVGASPDTLERVHRVAGDEFRHARICRAVFEAAGGEGVLPLDHAALSSSIALGRPLGEQVAVRTLIQLAIGETLAVPLFQALRDEATVEVAVDALDTFLRDDAFHAAVGWDVLDELIELWPDAVPGVLRAEARGALDNFWRRYAGATHEVPVEARAWGLMDGSRYEAIATRCLGVTVCDRLRERSLLDGTWAPPSAGAP